MLDIFAAYATDETKEVEGAVVQLGGGATMTVARIGNPNYTRVIIAEHEKAAEALKNLPDAEARELDVDVLCGVLAETILLGFTDISFQGKPMKYSKANAVKLLKIKDFRVRVLKEASDLENYRAKFDEAAVKN